MKRLFAMTLVALMMTSLAVAMELGGATLPDTLMADKNTLLLTGLEMVFGGLSLCTFLFIHPVEFNIVWILPLLILGLFFALSWLTYNLGIQKIGASKTAIMYSSKSVFTLSFSFLSVKFFPSLGLKIPLSLLSFLIGGSIIIIGVVLLKMFKSS